ncbi:polysaccharide biosynthesis tyrosine autokinase [Caulobacter segnis]|uniref:GumC family protein n=1 Tax=Caulobacter segnis TaxID=88688 RepID=UPI00240F0479|nr:polysaccharide biosynthesis tyrosine autokinase [Caulobacter segnis]MDG2520482.1 polysaccharide biosynthesis tyrosine autokinase [Caulobacter segnis]
MNSMSPNPAGPAADARQDGGDVGGFAFAPSLDLTHLISIFRRRLRLFGAVALAVFVAAVIFTLLSTPKYTATANVMLDTRQEQVTDVAAVMSGLPADTAVVDTEVEILKSRQLAERVVTRLKLDQDPEFNPLVAKPSGIKMVVGGIASLVGAAKPDNTKLDPVEAQRQREAIVDRVLGGLGVRRSGLTYVINVSYTSVDPAKSAKIANAFADLYLLEQLEAKFDATKQANTWLNTKLNELRGQVQTAENAVAQYKIANNLLSSSGATLTEQEISAYNQQVATSRAAQAEQEARLSAARRQLAAGASGQELGEALDSQVIQQLRQQRATISGRVADLSGRYGARHPEMLKAQRELEDVDAQIQAETRRIITNLETQAQIARQRTGSMAGSLGAARGTLASNNKAAVRLRELERDAEAVRTLYESYLNRFKETSSQQGIEASDARVVSKAKIPTGQSAPKVPLNLALGFVLAVGAGFAALIVAEMLDSGLTTSTDVEKRLGVAYLGGVPTLASVADTKSAPVDFVVEKPLSGFSEAFRNLRASIRYAKLGQQVQVVAITSSLPGEGKTTTSISLGRAIAMQGQRTVVVDCDLRRRTVNRVLGVEPSVGLLEVLSGQATLDQVLKIDPKTGAAFLPLAATNFTPKDVFGTEAMDKLLGELRRRFDMVILDTAPLLPVADTRVLAPKADAVVFLARWRKTPQKAIESALDLLRGTGAHLAGVALTQIDMKEQARYGYGDAGYYYGEYKKYYAS